MSETMKCWTVDDNADGYTGTEYAAQVIAAPTRTKAKSFAKSNWFYDIEYIHLNVRRFNRGDELAKSKQATCEIDDEQELRSIGFKWFCNDCETSYLSGDDCNCGKKIES